MSLKKETRVCKTVGYGGILPKMRTAMRIFFWMVEFSRKMERNGGGERQQILQHRDGESN